MKTTKAMSTQKRHSGNTSRLVTVGGTMIRLNVKEAAEREGYNNANELSEATGLPYETCRKLWRGEAKRIDLGTMERLCDLLRLRPGQLFDYEYEPDKPKRKARAKKGE